MPRFAEPAAPGFPPHSVFLAEFDRALRGGALPEGVTATDPAEAERRFAVYRNNVAVGLIEALAARFPAIKRLVGAEFFHALARLYAEAERPRSPVLLRWGAGFADFLEQFPPLAGYPYLGDVARIEFARGEAFHAADATPLPASELLDAAPEALRLHLHPSLRLLRLAHPAVTIWARNQPAAPPSTEPLPAGGEIALIWRDSSFDVPVVALSAADAALIEALLAGETLATAAQGALSLEAHHNPQPLLVALMRTGAIVTPQEARK